MADYRGALSRIGGVGGHAGFELDGTLCFYDGATTWDDLEGQLFNDRFTSPASRIALNTTDITLDFEDNAVYPDDFMPVSYQMRHRYVLESAFDLHLHWLQAQNAIPNWLAYYRIMQNGSAPGVWTLMAYEASSFTYSSGTLLQITDFPSISGVNNLSFAIQVKLFRDTSNASGLFAGNDPYTGAAQAVFLDIHFENDTLGSRHEYVK